MAAIVLAFRRRQAVSGPAKSHIRLVVLMTAVVALLNLAHVVEVAIWAAAYWILGVGPESARPFYFALVNFTTLGYGDVLPAPGWELIGPLTAMNVILVLGWSTAAIFAVLSSQLPRAGVRH
ncbi:two pore domain potassium channel family protein [Hansschlegelia zhihuaiae]|uniref:Two pore domain potassium channel family protein n=2 Tax=Hansschlegelia zhihuaiae TaxID=405005 RepID=A0A4Q0M5E3_9HYPH|nr:two pore domain potassium channel family protein [Hansschlegelia zhihuaiae]